ncbi:hypothetical protein [Halomonas huangheensis]|uniref:Uncharacterized protein n=1 Tax=Halomonas huangheensis TaxID=1178482 RepID=W1NAN5_9GAMM|nr:hypothetical protein [Halomonas huangheensis]ALM53814.1 hypothetical protein AR456_17205 [Halomonas huangheensis]ERL52251.1 hypothetical protein BJB45_09805 [Halomonas huangheensis]
MKVTSDRNIDNYRLLDSAEAVTEARHGETPSPADAPRAKAFSAPPFVDGSSPEATLSLRARLARATAPVAGDLELYSGARGIELLQHVVDSVLPQLETGSDIAELAAQLIKEEIGMRTEWEARRVEESES